MLIVLQGLLGLCLLAFLSYTGLAVRAAYHWRKERPNSLPDWTPPVTILKPVRGVDAEAYTNFISFCQQDYPADQLQIVFGALDSGDPALELVCRLQKEFPRLDIITVNGGPDSLSGYNLKVCNLRNMLPHARHDLLVLCDSDMRVEPDYLRRVVAPFRNNASVGLVTCPYRGAKPDSLPGMLEALGIGADFIPSTLVSRMLEGVGFAFGSTIALQRRVLEEMGGFEAIADDLADDFRLGSGVRQLGYEVVLSDYVVDDVLGKEQFGAMWSRRLRWARTVRACRPAGYAGAFITHGFALSLLFLIASGFSSLGAWVAGSALLVRVLTALLISRLTGDPNIPRFLPLLPASDLLSFALYLTSFCGNRLVWRGTRFRLLPGGKLAPE